MLISNIEYDITYGNPLVADIFHIEHKLLQLGQIIYPCEMSHAKGGRRYSGYSASNTIPLILQDKLVDTWSILYNPDKFLIWDKQGRIIVGSGTKLQVIH